MGTIRTAIQVNDMMSQQFRAMNMAMSTVIDSFQTLQDATGEAVDVGALEAAQRELQQVEANFNEIEREIRQAENAQENLNRDIRKGDEAASDLMRTVGGIAATYLTLQTLGNAINISDEMTNTIARLDMMNDGLQTTEQLQKMIYNAAQRSYGLYSETADLVAKLGMNASDAFGSNAETIAFAELLNKQFVIAGTAADGISAATLQLTQALGSGVLRGEELNSIFEQAPNILHTIADYLDVGIGQIRELASEGQITADIVKKAMFAAADDINQKFDSMPLTFEQLWTSFKNEALMAFQPVLQQLNDLANSERFAGFINSMIDGMYLLASAISWVYEIASSIGSYIYDHWSILGPIILGIAGALSVLAATLIVVRLWILLATAAQWAYNAAMMANPIGLVIAAIVLLIGLFIAVIQAINHFAGTSISATGVVVGVFLAALSVIANMFIYLWNVAVEVFATIYNIAATLTEGLVNLFSGDLGAIGRMFVQLGDHVLGILESIAKAIDFVFGSNLAESWGGYRDSLAAWSAENLGENEYKMNRMNASDFQLKTFDTFAAYEFGYDWGANLKDNLNFSDFDFSSPALDSMDLNLQSLAGDFKGLENAGKDTAGNTKKMADSMEMGVDDLSYLRDIAEREAINRYTTGNIKVEMKNENHINSELDIDGVIDRFGERAEEVVEQLAEGGEVNV